MAVPTNPIYKFIKDQDGNNTVVKKRAETSGSQWVDVCIPLDNPTGKHYKKYKEWVDAGNTAEAAD